MYEESSAYSGTFTNERFLPTHWSSRMLLSASASSALRVGDKTEPVYEESSAYSGT